MLHCDLTNSACHHEEGAFPDVVIYLTAIKIATTGKEQGRRSRTSSRISYGNDNYAKITLSTYLLVKMCKGIKVLPQSCGEKILICAVCGLCLTRTGFAGTIVGVFYHE